MSSKEFDVNGTDYTITITEQVISHVNNLKNLYIKVFTYKYCKNALLVFILLM